MQYFFASFLLTVVVFTLYCINKSLQRQNFGFHAWILGVNCSTDDFMRHWIPTGHTSSQDVYEYNQQRPWLKKLIALPPVLVEGLRNKKKVVLDAYGTILFMDIVSFTVFQQIYRQSGSYRY